MLPWWSSIHERDMWNPTSTTKNIDLNIDLTKNKQNSLKESWQQEVFREGTPFGQVFRPKPSDTLGGPGRTRGATPGALLLSKQTNRQ